MDTALGRPAAAVVAPAAPATEGAEAFDTAKAINYSVANLGASVFYGLFNFAMPFYLDSHKLPAWLIGLLANERSCIGAFVQPVVGRISDHLHTPLGRRRPFFVIGIPVVCLGLYVLGLHPVFWVMLGVMSVLAFFLSVAWDPYMAMMADLFPEKQRGRIGGLVGMGTGVGNIIFVGLAALMWEKQQAVVFLSIAVILILTFAYTFFTVKEPAATPAPEHPKTRIDARAYVKGILRYPEAAKYTVAIMFFWFGAGGVIPFVTLFGKKVLGATETEAFFLPLAAVISSALTAVPIGLLTDRTSKKLMLGSGMLLYGLAALVGSQAESFFQGVVVMSIAGVAVAATSQINPMLSDIVPKKRMAEFIGLGSAVFSFAQPLGSVFAGAVVTIAGRMLDPGQAYRWAFIYAGVMIITAVVIIRTVHPERFVDREEEEPGTSGQAILEIAR